MSTARRERRLLLWIGPRLSLLVRSEHLWLLSEGGCAQQGISNLGDENINREWFRGEEFQTLLFETIHQLHVTQDKTKIEMLGKALANSGATEFKEESFHRARSLKKIFQTGGHGAIAQIFLGRAVTCSYCRCLPQMD